MLNRPNTRTEKKEIKKLIKAAEKGKLQKVEEVIKFYPELIDKQSDQGGNTALIKAAKNGHLDIVKFLDRRGANLIIKNKKGRTALEQARKHKKFDIKSYTDMSFDVKSNTKRRHEIESDKRLIEVESYLADRIKPTFTNTVKNLGFKVRGQALSTMSGMVRDATAVGLPSLTGPIVTGLVIGTSYNNIRNEREGGNDGFGSRASTRRARLTILVDENNDSNDSIGSPAVRQRSISSHLSGGLFTQRTNVTTTTTTTTSTTSTSRSLSNEERLEKCEYKGEIPAAFICSISQCIMDDPVTISSSGQTYERKSLMDAFAFGDATTITCPNTRTIIHKKELENKTNYALKNLITDFVDSIEKQHGQQQTSMLDNKPKTTTTTTTTTSQRAKKS